MIYLTRPVFQVRPSFEELDHGQLDDFVYESQGQGLSTPWKPTTATKRSASFPFVLGTKLESKEMRVFFENMRGTGDGFWLPLYTNELPLVQDLGAGDSRVEIQDTGYQARWARGAQFRHIAILDRSGMVLAGVKSIELGDETLFLNLSEPIQQGFQASETVICGAMFCRLDTDELEYEYQTNGVVRVQVDFVELPRECPNPVGAPDAGGTPRACEKPIYLYRFTRETRVWRFCNYGVSMVVAGSTWQAADISHGQVKAGADFFEEGLEITLATDDPLHPFRYYVARESTEPTYVDIYRTDADTLVVETEPIYTGRLGPCDFERQGVILSKVSSVLRFGEVEIPKLKNQRLCHHRLGDAFCKVVVADFTTTGILSVVTPGYVEAAAVGLKVVATGDANWFALGRITVGQETRFITGTNGGQRLYINLPFVNATVGAPFSALAGDDKRVLTCQNKFSNEDNFLAAPYAPNNDPQFKALDTPQPTGGKK